MVVWFLVHCLHQIITTATFTIIGIVHVQLCRLPFFARVDMFVQMVRKVAFSIYLKFRGVMEHSIGHFITPLHGEAKHPKGAPHK